jgi:hypothetical protein
LRRPFTRAATEFREARARFVATTRSGTSPVSLVPPVTIASALVVRPKRRYAVAS